MKVLDVEIRDISPAMLYHILRHEHLWTPYQVKDLLKVIARKQREAAK